MSATICLPPAAELGSPHSLPDSLSYPPALPLSTPNDSRPETEDDTESDLNLNLTDSTLEDRRASIYSSVSSLPASVLHHEPLERTPTRPQLLHSAHSARHGSGGSFASGVTPSRRRDYASGFRNPSSVRAMLMRDELDDERASVTSHRRSGSQYSIRSHSNSPSKRISRSSHSSPLKSSKLKKEFPLVLLHCTLLPPSSGLMTSFCDNELFGALLPEEFRKRWTTLQERLAMPEVQARGILIPHPQDEYELLEERVFETLELERPRIRSNHFLPNGGADSGFESGSQTDEEVELESLHEFTCPDCGKGVGKDNNRKWEVKVYAANGLMRAGAWGAAWRDMEKVDIEISLCLPEDVRQEVTARLQALQASEHDRGQDNQSAHDYTDSREREVYGEESPAGPAAATNESGLEDEYRPSHSGKPRTSLPPVAISWSDHLRDTRTIAIILLSVILMYLGVNVNERGNQTVRKVAAASSETSITTTTVTSTAISTELMPQSAISASEVASKVAYSFTDTISTPSPIDTIIDVDQEPSSPEAEVTYLEIYEESISRDLDQS